MIQKMMSVASQLSATQRYSQTRLTNPESVLEHQGFVALTALLITWRLNSHGEDFDLERIVCAATIHDLDEIGTGDVPRPTKYSSDLLHRMLDSLAEKTVERLADELMVPQANYTWIEAKKGRHGLVVSLCDALAVLYKLWQEVVLFGNISIIDHAGPIGSILNDKFVDLIDGCRTPDAVDFVSDMRNEAFDLLGSIQKRKA